MEESKFRALNVEVDEGLLTTRAQRVDPAEQRITAACPVHGSTDFEYNVAMDAWFCAGYWWGSTEGFTEGRDCDCVVLALDAATEGREGDVVRHRDTLEPVGDEEYASPAGGEKFRLTERKEPTPPPGFEKMKNVRVDRREVEGRWED
jgi:hypothetical protein